MAIERAGIRIACEQCVCIAAEDGFFDVRVPVIVTGNDSARGTAVLRCHVASGSHTIELREWIGADMTQHSQGIDEVLRFVADKKLCGNKRLCPRPVADVATRVKASRPAGGR